METVLESQTAHEGMLQCLREVSWERTMDSTAQRVICAYPGLLYWVSVSDPIIKRYVQQGTSVEVEALKVYQARRREPPIKKYERMRPVQTRRTGETQHAINSESSWNCSPFFWLKTVWAGCWNWQPIQSCQTQFPQRLQLIGWSTLQVEMEIVTCHRHWKWILYKE